jgi:hypothetical protein
VVLTAIPVLRHQTAGDGAQLPGAAGRGALHVALVYAPDGVRLAVACRTAGALARRLSRYVLEHATHQLWPDDAERVRLLAKRGKLEAAVAHYFARVGERWDEERLVKVRALVARL